MTDVWNERAEAYRQSETHATGADLDLVVAWCEPAPGVTVLDVATGGGHVARRLREAGAKVVTVDAAPGMEPDVIAPADHLQTAAAVRDTYDRPGPIYYRIGKRDDYSIPHLDGRFALGRADVVREGNDVLMVTLGSISAETCAAAEALATQGVEATIAVVSSLRPAPIEDLRRLLSRFGTSITVEEHYVDCGLGSLVAEVAAEYATGCRVVRCGVRRLPVGASGSEAYMRDIHGLSQDGISRQVLQALGETSK